MTTLIFEHSRVHDQALPLTLEEIFKHYAAWSGILSTSFDALCSYSSQSITGGIASGWDAAWMEDELPANFTAYYTEGLSNQGAAFQVGGSIYHFVTTIGSVEVYKNGDLVYYLPKSVPTYADVAITFRQQRLSENESDGWMSISLYMNNLHIASYTEYSGTVISPIYMGFCSYDQAISEYTNIRVPELCDTAEYGTLDPGELPTGGLSRTMEGRYLRWMIRYDGSLHAWKTKAVASDHTFSEKYAISANVDATALVTHVRMMGAYIWAEAYDEELSALYGHRFREVDNPMLLTEGEVYIEAEKTLKRFEESAFTGSVDVPFLATLEPDDRVTINGEDWLVTDVNWTADIGNINMSLTLRKYVWGEP